MSDDLSSIIIPCFNQLEYTRLCVDSIFRFTGRPYELIMIDNGSEDGTGEFLESLRSSLPASPCLTELKVIAHDRNIGVASALNEGIRASRGDYICYLNNDTMVTSGWLEGLVRCVESDPAAGIAGCRTNLDSEKIFSPDLEGFRNAKELQKTAAVISLLYRGEYTKAHYVHGFCMFMKREVVERVGLFDESFYPCGCEDFDFCLRARKAGYRLLNAGDVFVFHFHSRSTNSDAFRRRYRGIDSVTEEAQRRFVRKWGCAGRLFLKRLGELIDEERSGAR